MIEWRASLHRDITFESGNKLKAGTIIYVEEGDAGWIASHYSEQGSSTCFAIDPSDFSIWRKANTMIEYVVAQESDPDEDRRLYELQIKRTQRQIEDYRREAERLEALITKETNEKQADSTTR